MIMVVTLVRDQAKCVLIHHIIRSRGCAEVIVSHLNRCYIKNALMIPSVSEAPRAVACDFLSAENLIEV
jgi:hypothetical protein